MPGMYFVVNTALMPSVKRGNDTSLQLRDNDNQVIQAVMLGTDTSLVPGVWITNAKIKQREREGVVYHILESYDIYGREAA